MAYSLTLTREDRKAIDFVGHRYWHGDDLWLELETAWDDTCDEECPWDDPGDIEFTIPEYVAWDIKEGLESEGLVFALFNEELSSKLLRFYNGIV